MTENAGSSLTEKANHVVFLDHDTSLLHVGDIVKLLLVVIQLLLEVMLYVSWQASRVIQSPFYRSRPFLEPAGAGRLVFGGAPPLLAFVTLVLRCTFACLASDRCFGAELGELPLRAHFGDMGVVPCA